MRRRSQQVLKAERRLRGTPEETRARLVAAAAELFNRDGYLGTDSVRIARAAGYASGTFYKHFADKRAALLAAYEGWVDAEWRAVEDEVAAGGSAREIADRIVRLVSELHQRWRGLRAALATLLAADAGARRFHRDQRRRQLAMVSALRRQRGKRPRPAEQDAVLLYTLERTCDAVAAGELRDLALDRDATLAVLREQLEDALG
jgi:AcrR family transcriptional regulator